MKHDKDCAHIFCQEPGVVASIGELSVERIGVLKVENVRVDYVDRYQVEIRNVN